MNVSLLTIALLFLAICFEASGSIPLVLRVLLVDHSFIYREQFKQSYSLKKRAAAPSVNPM